MVESHKDAEQEKQSQKAPSAKRWLWLLPLAAFAAFVVLMYFRLGDETQITPQTALNRPVPAFSLANLRNTDEMLTQVELPKVPFLLNIWGSWCPSCRVEHPFFMQLHEQGLPIVGVNYRDELVDALAYLDQLGDPYAQIVQDSTGSLAVDLGLTGAPESFVVDAAGNIRQHIVGVVDEALWDKRVAPCLEVLNKLGGQVADGSHESEIAGVCK